jgi:hypothetical protein
MCQTLSRIFRAGKKEGNVGRNSVAACGLKVWVGSCPDELLTKRTEAHLIQMNPGAGQLNPVSSWLSIAAGFVHLNVKIPY